MQQKFIGAVWQGELRADEGGCTHVVLQYVNEIFGIVAQVINVFRRYWRERGLARGLDFVLSGAVNQ